MIEIFFINDDSIALNPFNDPLVMEFRKNCNRKEQNNAITRLAKRVRNGATIEAISVAVRAEHLKTLIPAVAVH